jgi:hypothetical protein
MARKVKKIHQIEIRAKIGKRKAAIHEVDLVSLLQRLMRFPRMAEMISHLSS